MKKIKLAQGKYAIVDNEDYHYLFRFSWQYISVNGLENVKRTFNTKFGPSHINIEDYIVARPQGGARVVSFKNKNRLDFRKKNLEFRGIEAVKHQSRKQLNCTSTYKGVSKDFGRRGYLMTKEEKLKTSEVEGRKIWRAQIEKGIKSTKGYIKKQNLLKQKKRQ